MVSQWSPILDGIEWYGNADETAGAADRLRWRRCTQADTNSTQNVVAGPVVYRRSAMAFRNDVVNMKSEPIVPSAQGTAGHPPVVSIHHKEEALMSSHLPVNEFEKSEPVASQHRKVVSTYTTYECTRFVSQVVGCPRKLVESVVNESSGQGRRLLVGKMVLVDVEFGRWKFQKPRSRQRHRVQCQRQSQHRVINASSQVVSSWSSIVDSEGSDNSGHPSCSSHVLRLIFPL
ncbi:unnamed protein product [Haemonchus placei]|uniref:Uncharacterized protein n=1 Tax=Haemonchus placei TaxID=6290 RepID=A0A0N4WXF1_HAEPC|nr:unnamed protein product [Haemonchus placei]